ncbi:hypothetical protein PG988_016107 [Apiospora saccharicola]
MQELLTKNHVSNVRSFEDVTGGQFVTVGSFEPPLVEANRQGHAPEYLSQNELAMQEKMCTLMAESEILGSFSFPSMTTRQEHIEKAHTKTFRWVHEEPGPVKRSWHNLVAWLRHGNGIYWVNGKLASGKSTLMKHLYGHSTTRNALSCWSKDRPVEISSFFFWDSGDEDQKSQRGLLRSLLLQIFQRHRNMLQHVLPDTWGAHYARARALLSRKGLSPDSPLIPPKPPELILPQLRQAFHDLLVSLKGQVNLCFFIDGLDEYAGDYQELAEFLQQNADLSGVKFCISSRPLPVFEQAFRDSPGLRLQDLTKRDIKEYVSCHLYSHRYTSQLERRNPDEIAQLIAEIVHKARGVFLWVKLVTRSLLRGLSDYNRISDLKKRVSYLPSDLEALYKHILDGSDPFYKMQMSQIFQVFRAAQSRSPGLVTLFNLSWADDEDGLLVETATIRPCTGVHVKERCEVMEARLKSVCAGLLETANPRSWGLGPDCRVLYLHRTVADWLEKPEVWASLASITAGTGFSPNLAMLKSRIMMLKTWNPEYHGRMDMNIVVDALNYARGAESDLQCGFPKLLDQLDAATEFHWRNTKGFASHLRPKSSLLPKSTFSMFSYSSSSSSDSSTESWYSFPNDAESESGDIIAINSQTLHSSVSAIPIPTHEPPPVCPEEELEGRLFQEIGLDLPHWSQSIEVPGGRTLGGHATFFDLARAFGLTHYVDAKYDAGHAFVEHEVSHWLLMQAFSGTCGSASTNTTRPKDPDPELVERILASGIDPNLSFDGGMTPWQGALLDAFWHLSRGPQTPLDHPQAWRQKAQAWAQILEHFLAHGAEPHCPAVRLKHLPGFPRVTPRALVEVYDINSLADEARRLEACINSEVVRRTTRPKPTLIAPAKAPDAIHSTMAIKDPARTPDNGVERRGIIQWLFSQGT